MDDIREDEERVAEEATAETPKEQTEQRTDDYECLSRKIEDVASKLDEMNRKLDGLNAMYSTFVDAGAIVSNAGDAVAAAAAAGVADALEDFIDLEALDYSL